MEETKDKKTVVDSNVTTPETPRPIATTMHEAAHEEFDEASFLDITTNSAVDSEALDDGDPEELALAAAEAGDARRLSAALRRLDVPHIYENGEIAARYAIDDQRLGAKHIRAVRFKAKPGKPGRPSLWTGQRVRRYQKHTQNERVTITASQLVHEFQELAQYFV